MEISLYLLDKLIIFNPGLTLILRYSNVVKPNKFPKRKSHFLKPYLDLIGECSRSESSSNGCSTSVGCKLQDCTLANGSGGNDKDICRMFNGHDGTSSQQKLLPCASQVQDMDT